VVLLRFLNVIQTGSKRIRTCKIFAAILPIVGESDDSVRVITSSSIPGLGIREIISFVDFRYKSSKTPYQAVSQKIALLRFWGRNSQCSAISTIFFQIVHF